MPLHEETNRIKSAMLSNFGVLSVVFQKTVNLVESTMVMKIEFVSKEKSRREQEQAFLALSPSERVQRFFRLMEQMSIFPKKMQSPNKNNFLILIESPDDEKLE